MTGDTEREKRLLGYLDLILAGREDEITGPLDEDTRSALDFARRMASMQQEPSPEFAENLKAQLVHRLAEQEKKHGPDNMRLIFWDVPRKTMWQGTIAAAITLIIIAAILVITLLLNQN